MILTMKNVSLILLCLLPNVNCKINTSMRNQKSELNFEITSEHFSNFMHNLGIKYFKKKEVIYFLIPTDKGELLYTIIDESIQKLTQIWSVFTNDSYCCKTVPMQILPYNKKVEEYHVPGVYVIPFYREKSFDHFQAQMKKLEWPDHFNPRALFFILLTDDCAGETSQKEASNQRVFNFMWRKNLFATTLFVFSICNNQTTVASARPFSSEKQCRTVLKNGIHYHNVSKTTDTNIDIVYNEPKTLQKCDIFVATIPLPPYVVGKPTIIKNQTYYDYVGGIEIELLRLLSERMNFTFQFHKTYSYGLDAWFVKFPNGTVIGILQDLIDHNIDMAFGGFIPDYVTYYKYDYSVSYKFSSISYYVPDPNFIPQWLIFYRAFSIEVWILSVFVFFIVSLLYYVMEKFGFFNRNLQNNFKGIHFADFFSINLGMGSMLDPKSEHLRVLFFAWAIYSVHWYSAYTSILFTYITNPPLEKEIRTIRDLKESGLKISIDITYKEIFTRNKIGDVSKSILDNHLICTKLETCVQKVVQDRNLSIMDKAEGIEYLVSLKRSKIHKLSQNMMTYFVSTITTRGNPVSQEFSRVALKAFQVGLLNKWETDVILQYRSVKSVEVPSEDDSMPLSVKDLIGSFLILIFGLLISFIVFAIEILLSMYNKDKVEVFQHSIES